MDCAKEIEQALKFETLDCHYDETSKGLFFRMRASPRPSFSPQLMEDLREFQATVVGLVEKGVVDIDYLIVGSSVKDVFSLGGDLSFFVETIRAGKRDALEAYALLCIDVLYANYVNLGKDLTTVALIEGDALGAAIETALTCDVIVAEKNVKLAFPEVVFNMFPGMGAYSFLARRISPQLVENMITSGKTFTAQELFDMGLIDVLTEPGEGKEALNNFIRRHRKTKLTRKAVLNMRNRVFPVSYDELKNITLMWVEAAFQLPERDLKMMERLVKAQGKLLSNVA